MNSQLSMKRRDDVAGDHLQIGEAATLLGARIRGIGQRGHADQRERARFRRDDRQADDDQDVSAAAEKIIFDRSVGAAKTAAEGGDADEIERQDDVVESGEPQQPTVCTWTSRLGHRTARDCMEHETTGE